MGTATYTQEQSQTIEQIVAVNMGRAGYYRMLGSLFFTELTQAQVDHLAAMDMNELDGGDETIAEGYADISRYLAKRASNAREELAVDYAHVFLAAGNYETYAATPYESVFTSEVGLLMQEARDEVYKMYCDEHVQPDESLHVPEDHITFEFQFMATLIERMNEALQSGDLEEALYYAQTCRKFHQEHQINWVDDLCDAVMDCAKTRFYRGVSKVTRGYVHMETEVIDDVIAALQELRGVQAAA